MGKAKAKAKPTRQPFKSITSMDDLTADDRNANRGTPAGGELIQKSLRDYGAGRSVVADRDGRVIAGNKTVENARAAGIDRVRVVTTDGTELVVVQRTDLTLDEKRARELAIADNRAGQISLEWDAPQLQSIAEDFGIDLGAVGFPDGIPGVGANGEGTGDDDNADVPTPETAPKRVDRGDVWELGDHVLMCGDCREGSDVATLLGQARIDVAFTSPPYAAQRAYDEDSGFKPIKPDDYVEWWDAVQRNVRAYLAPTGSFFVNIKPHCEDGQRVLYVMDLVLAMARRWGWRFVDEFCWRKSGVPGKWPNRFKNQFEPVYHFSADKEIKMSGEAVSHPTDRAVIYRKDARKSRTGFLSHRGDDNAIVEGDALPGNVLELDVENKQTDNHSAPFPVGLPSFFIKAFSDAGDVIYEPFAGSGTTLVASERLGRRCFAMEISAKYCDVILARWEGQTGKAARRVEQRQS